MTEVTKELAHLVQLIDEARREGYDEGYDEGEAQGSHVREEEVLALRAEALGEVGLGEDRTYWTRYDVERGAISPEFVTVALVGL